MRVLHLTDTHLGVVRVVQRPGEAHPSSTLVAQDAERALRAALAPALHGEVDLVVHTGDVFDRSRPPRRVVQAAAELFALVARRVPTVLMAGNHDRRGLLRHLPVQVAGLHVIDRPTRLEVGGLALGVVPFERTAAGWAVAAQLAVGPGVDLLLAHQAFHGHAVPTAFREGVGGEEPARWFRFRTGVQADTIGEEHVPASVRHVLCGHLHPRQVVEVGEATVVCPGSTVRTSFAERHVPCSVAHWGLDREVSWAFRDVPSRPMHVVAEGAAGEAALARVRPGDLVRVASEARLRLVHARGGWVVGAARPERAPRASSPSSAQLTLLPESRRG